MGAQGSCSTPQDKPALHLEYPSAMGHYRCVLKKTFWEFSYDSADVPQVPARCRAVSEFTGTCQVRAEEREVVSCCKLPAVLSSSQLSTMSGSSNDEDDADDDRVT